MKPYLQELQQRLGQQYLVSFQARPNEADSYEHFRFTTEVPGVELVAPNHIYVPGGAVKLMTKDQLDPREDQRKRRLIQ